MTSHLWELGTTSLRLTGNRSPVGPRSASPRSATLSAGQQELAKEVQMDGTSVRASVLGFLKWFYSALVFTFLGVSLFSHGRKRKTVCLSVVLFRTLMTEQVNAFNKDSLRMRFLRLSHAAFACAAVTGATGYELKRNAL